MKKKHWKQHVTTVILSATLFLVLIFMSGKLGMVAYASDKISGEVGTLKWYLEEQKDVVDEKEQVETALVISGKGEIPDYKNPEDRPWNGIANQIEKVEIKSVKGKDNITKIGARAFENLPNLSRVWIPSSVRIIEKDAFKNCPKLDFVTIMSSTISGVDEEAFDPDIILDDVCDHMYMGRVYVADDIVMATLKKDGKCSYEIYCSGCGDYVDSAGDQKIPFIKSIYLQKKNYVYTGKKITPEVIVKDRKRKVLEKNSDYKLKYSAGRQYVGTYAVKVNGYYKYRFTKKLFFIIRPQGTKIVKISAGKKAFTVKVQKQSIQTTGYEIAYSTNKNFAKGTEKKLAIPSNKTTKKKITGLKKGRKYYVKACTYKTVKGKKYHSRWSEVKTVRVK